MLRGIKVTGGAESRHKYQTGAGRLCCRTRTAAQAGARCVLPIAPPPKAGACSVHTSQHLWPRTLPSPTKPARTCAPVLLRLLGKLYGTDGSFEEGTRVVREFMVDAGVDDNDLPLRRLRNERQRRNRPALALTRLLSYASRQPWGCSPGAIYACPWPVWTAHSTIAPRPLRSRAGCGPKTGTLDEVNALSELPDHGKRQGTGVFHSGE